MSQNVSLKDAERKVFTSTFQHGLWDIFIGCFLLMFSIAPLLSPTLGDFWSSVVFLPFYALVYFILWLVRKYVIAPRVGIVKFGQMSVTRMIRFNVVMFPALILALILGILSFVQFDSIPGWMHTARFSLIFLIGFCIAAYILDFSRLYIYGLLIAFAPLIGEWLYVYQGASHHGYPITFGILAGIIILTGLMLLGRFLQEHPSIDPSVAEETTE